MRRADSTAEELACERKFVAAFVFWVFLSGTYTVLAFAGVVPW
jgi:hypothetical protein